MPPLSVEARAGVRRFSSQSRTGDEWHLEDESRRSSPVRQPLSRFCLPCKRHPKALCWVTVMVSPRSGRTA